MRPPTFRILALALIAASALATSAAADAAVPAIAVTPIGSPDTLDFAPGEVVVKFRGETDATVSLPQAISVSEATEALRRNPRVEYAAPNFIATASSIPNDTGELPGIDALEGGWQAAQWNFLPHTAGDSAAGAGWISPGGIDAIGAWDNLRAENRPGAKGVRIAVLDTGVAYRNWKQKFHRSPDLSANTFAPGYDFVKKNRYPLDRNGHGTHIASIIAERSFNRIGLTGLAYRARVIPIRVLDTRATGRSDIIAKGIRWAVNSRADVINMSFNFACGETPPNVVNAIRFARQKKVLMVASAGNAGCVSLPATAPGVIGVGATTEGGCLANYSQRGPDVDIAAPGGGSPASDLPCTFSDSRPIFQVTMVGGNPGAFGIPTDYTGTSMAAAHVSATAAMVIAGGVVGRDPGPAVVQRRIYTTAQKLSEGKSPAFGHGLIDAAGATDPAVAARRATRPSSAAMPAE